MRIRTSGDLLTGAGTPETERQVYALGVNEFVEKEFSLHRQGEALTRALKPPRFCGVVGGNGMAWTTEKLSLTIREAERKIIAQWREWSEHRGAYAPADILECYSGWLVKARPDLVLFQCEEDRWHKVKSWIQKDEAIQSKLRKAPGA